MRKLLRAGELGRGFAWFDTGTHNSLLEAASFISAIEARQGLRIAVPEEVAVQNVWINVTQLCELALGLQKSGCGRYLLKIAERQY